jgi:hypothetical protein
VGTMGFIGENLGRAMRLRFIIIIIFVSHELFLYYGVSTGIRNG